MNSMNLFTIKLLLLLLILDLSSFGLFAQNQCDSINNGSAQIFYQITGKGQPILIISGGPGLKSRYMSSVANELGKSYKCILVEQRGIGRSTVPKYDTSTISLDKTINDFEFLRKHLGIKDWVVLGHSCGGLNASKYAVSYPASVSALILVETIGLNLDSFKYLEENVYYRLLPSDIELAGYWTDTTVIARYGNRASIELFKTLNPAYFFDRKKSFELSQPLSPDDWNSEVYKLIFDDYVKQKIDLTQPSRQLLKPVLIISGRQSFVGESIPLNLSTVYPDSKMVMVERCGHYVWIEQPTIFYKEIDDFIFGLK
jgi:proline iminopeptidase